MILTFILFITAGSEFFIKMTNKDEIVELEIFTHVSDITEDNMNSKAKTNEEVCSELRRKNSPAMKVDNLQHMKTEDIKDETEEVKRFTNETEIIENIMNNKRKNNDDGCSESKPTNSRSIKEDNSQHIQIDNIQTDSNATNSQHSEPGNMIVLMFIEFNL